MAGDPHFDSVISLLHCDGTNGSKTFTDVKGKTWIATGTAQITTSPPTNTGFNQAASIQGGSGRLMSGPNADWAFGAGDFTMEGRFYNSSGSGSPFLQDMSTVNEFHALFMDSTTSGRVRIDNSNIITGIVTPANAWFDYALVRSGNTLKAYVNGVQSGTTATLTGSILVSDGTGDVSLFSNASHPNWIGYADEIRITKGVARYLTDYTPETGPFPDSGIEYIASPLLIPVSFGTPNAMHDRTEQATSLTIPVLFGTPNAMYDRTEQATSLTIPVLFGTPNAAYDRTEQATSLTIPIQFGTPSSLLENFAQASGITIPITFGTPVGTSLLTCQVNGSLSASVNFGTPSARVDFICQATSLNVPVNMGRPATFYQIENAQTVYPIVTQDPAADGEINAPGGSAPYPATVLPTGNVQNLTWSVAVRLDGVDISSRLTGEISVDAEDDAARIAGFSMRVLSGEQITVPAWFGVPVEIDFVRIIDGVAQAPVRLFTGKVAQPTYDHVQKLVQFRCFDDLQNYCRENDISSLINGYSTVFAPLPDDGWSRAQELLSTRTASLSLGAYGVPRVTEWSPNGSIDWLFDASAILDETPEIDIPDWVSQTNTVEIEFSHSFSRLYRQEGTTSWTPPLTFQQMMIGHGVDNFNRFGPDSITPYKFLPKKTVKEAFDASGLVLNQDIVTPPPDMVNLFPGYYVDPSALGYPGIVFLEMPLDYVPLIAPTGQLTYYVSSKQSFTLCQGFLAFWARSWAQNVTQRVTATVRNELSVAQFGAVKSTQSASYTTDFDASGWESDAAKGLNANPAYGDAFVNPADVNAAYKMEIEKARRTIMQSHRRSTISFQTSLIPTADIGQRVKVEADGIKASGQVSRLGFSMDIDSGAAITSWTCACVTLAGSLTEHSNDLSVTIPTVQSAPSTDIDVDFSWEYEIIEDPPFGWENDPNYQPVYKKNEATMSVSGVPAESRDTVIYDQTATVNIGWVEDEFEVIA